MCQEIFIHLGQLYVVMPQCLHCHYSYFWQHQLQFILTDSHTLISYMMRLLGILSQIKVLLCTLFEKLIYPLGIIITTSSVEHLNNCSVRWWWKDLFTTIWNDCDWVMTPVIITKSVIFFVHFHFLSL